ncbi:hypothetical protein AB1K42_18800 [Roseibium algicola]|uniref:hypothetical protein n=1 Tax=Roseibium algicola TaxID=2857014 RepID=UPI00345B039B
MIAGRQDACAHNNALWCDAVLKTAGAKTEFHAGFWCARDKALPLYPNVVTLSPKQGVDFYAALPDLPKGAGVKDSFDSLDLAPYGFQRLFTGTWLFRPPPSAKRAPISSDWHKVATSESLKKWLAGWNENESLHAVFPSRLLERKTIDFAAIVKDGKVKAGAVFNTGPKLDGKDILGLSNVFCRKTWLYSALRDLLEPFPNRSICTYENDASVLPVYRQLGFEPCGQLSVWLKQ